MDDKTIVELYWQRDERAISETRDKYGRYCYAIANGILHSAPDAEECENDTYLDAWNAIPPHKPSLLKTFLGKTEFFPPHNSELLQRFGYYQSVHSSVELAELSAFEEYEEVHQLRCFHKAKFHKDNLCHLLDLMNAHLVLAPCELGKVSQLDFEPRFSYRFPVCFRHHFERWSLTSVASVYFLAVFVLHIGIERTKECFCVSEQLDTTNRQ